MIHILLYSKGLLRIAICLFLFLFFIPTIGAQSSHQKKKTSVQLAHDNKGKQAEFTATHASNFKVKLFSIDPPQTNKVHHWFLQVIDENGAYVNFGKVKVTGYHKEDKTKKFNYFNHVTKLCSEGKYVIGFVKLKDSGMWVLDISIDDFGKKDTITLEQLVVAKE